MANPNLFDKTHEALNDAILIGWDGCHKIYLAMDQQAAGILRADYPHVFEGSVAEMTNTIHEWWDESCGLRFISGFIAGPKDPDLAFVQLIGQFEEGWDEEI